MKVEQMSKHHQFVWNTLWQLDDGERITGSTLQERTGIEDRRVLYKVIKDLRDNGYLVGSSRTAENGGYFEIRDEIDLRRTLKDIRNSALSLLDTAQNIETAYNEKHSTGIYEEEDSKIDLE